MKHGNNNISNLKNVYELLKINGEAVRYTENIQWITIYENILHKLILGITDKGEYLFIDSGKLFLINEKKMFLYCVRLLEIPYAEIQKYIEVRFKNVLLEIKLMGMEIFPYYEIIEFALNNMFNDYWIELVWQWYEQLSQSDKIELCDLLGELTNMKKISQQNRNIAKREINRLVQDK